MSVLVRDTQGTVRFKANKIVRDLVDAARRGERMDLNDVAARVGLRYTLDEQQELYQLIGYTLDGYQDIFHADKLQDSLP